MEAQKLPPLRIHHFMLWTVVAALMLTVYKTEVNTNQFSASMHMGGVPSILVYSLCLTGLLLGLYWKREGHVFFDEPGQKAFILHGMFAIYSVAAAAFMSYGGRESDGPPLSRIAMAIAVLGGLIVGLVYLILIFRYSRQFHYLEVWRKFFFAVGILTLLQYALSFLVPIVMMRSAPGNVGSMMFVFLGLPVVTGLIELFYWFQAIRHDYREGTPYHWSHWLGAATWPAFRLIQVGTLLIVWLFMPEW